MAWSLASAQQLLLKARGTGKTQTHSIDQAQKRWSTRGIHLLIRMPDEDGDHFLRMLQENGIQPLAHVPDGWVSVVADESLDWNRLEGLTMEALQPTDKISPELADFENGYVVAEFHPDVEPSIARAIVLTEGLDALEHPDLLPWHVLVRGPMEQLRLLTQWDELAYLFPASNELLEGRSVAPCLGAQAGELSVGQYVARVGEGWDGPGLNAVSLNYYVLNTTLKLPAGVVLPEFERALAEWARHVDVQFISGGLPGSPRTLVVLFASGAHGDGVPFDGPGRVIAHTYYPAPPNPEPIAGDLHFDDDENWAARNELDFYSVALHELGHALGLAHSDNPGAVMYPFYRRSTTISSEDIAAIQSLYAPRQGVSVPPSALAIAVESTVTGPMAYLRGTVTGGTGDVRVTWTNSRGGSGVAQGGRAWSLAATLQAGLNAVTVSATDNGGSRVSRMVTLQGGIPAAAIDLRIVSPASGGVFDTASQAITLSGTSEGAARVTWANSRGGSGQASGTAAWTIASVNLLSGSNVITVTAHSQDGSSIARTLDVKLRGRDVTSPSLQIQSPNTTSVGTSDSTIIFRGTASDSSGVAEVTWSSSNGPAGSATGTSWWTTPPIPLLVGVNQITILARDIAGNSSWRSITVTRR